jgi:predicted Zn-dependent peptidase
VYRGRDGRAPEREGADVGPQVFQHTLPNGMVLLAERMEHVRSAAINFLVPAGSAFDRPGRLGTAAVLSELITRGAGTRDNRALTLALDNLGVDLSTGSRTVVQQVWGSTLARNLPAALDLYADILRRPHLPAGELEPVQALALQDLQGLEDSPQQKVMVELRKRYYPAPLNRYKWGTAEDIEGLTIDDVRAHYRRYFRPNGTILAVAGNVEWGPLRDQVERLFGDWALGEPADVTPAPHAPQSEHLYKDTQQTQVALAFPSVPVADPDYYAVRAADGVWSGGMSSRLFTEVREKRGLCYSVYTAHETLKDRGTMLAYVGSAVEQAQEALDVLVGELRRLKDGVTDDEIDRVKAKLKSSLIMQQESSGSRAGSIASDWYYLGRVRSFDEIQAAIDGLTPRAILGYLDRCPVKGLTLVTLGPQPLTMPE